MGTERKRFLTGFSVFLAVVFCALIASFGVFSSSDDALATDTNPTAYGSRYSAVLYDNTNGLPTSDVNAIAQTEEGFLWIGSYSGLIRYDGNTFYRYDSSVGVSSVVSLFVDSKNRLWIGTNDSGAFVLQGETFTPYNDADGLRSLSVRAMEEDADGNLLVATTMGLAYVDAGGKMHVLDDPQINREYVCELVKDADGVVYGVTDKGAFFAIRSLRVDGFFASLSIGGTVKTIYPDPKNAGYFYYGMDTATVAWGRLGQREKTYSVEPRRNVRCLRQFDSELLVCSDDGIGYLKDGVYVSIDELPMNNSVERVYSDFEKNLWFTSSRQGLMKIVRNRFDLLCSLSPRVVNSVYKQDGLYYIGTDDGLVLLDEDREPVENALTAYIGTARIRSVIGGNDGKIWFGTGSLGLVRYDPESGDVTAYDQATGLSHKHARTLKELSDGRIAVATKSGVNVIDGETVRVYDREKGVTNPEILCLEEGADGKIYAGSDGDGIYVIATSGGVTRIGRNDGLASEVILRLKRDPIDPTIYWVITSNSIAFMKDEKVTTVAGFPYANNFDLYFNKTADRMWVLSSNGIYVVQRSVMLANGSIDYVFYDSSDGLPSAATANSYSCLTEDGTLYIAASEVGSVNLDATYEFDSEVRLAVPYVTADETYIAVKTDGDKAVAYVPATCKRLVIGAYAFSYSLNNPRLTMQLVGFDEEKRDVLRRDMTPVTYTNLPGGTYTFVLSVVDPMTGESEQTYSVTIVKEKTMFEQAWFWVIVALLGAGTLVGVTVLLFRRKTKKLLEKQAKDKELIDEMTSVFASCIDLKDPYTNGHSHRVAKYTAMIAEKLGKSKEEVERYYRIALLHDIGKIAIPDSILNKPDRLTDEEFAVMKSHSQRGYDLLKEVKIVPDLAVGAGYHHERVDGRGYPNGLSQDEIPFVAQIIAVADTFDAMYSTRPYRKSLTLEQVSAELKRCAGTQLNETVVNAFLSILAEKDPSKIADEEPID